MIDWKKIAVGAALGSLVCWVYFFISLPFITRIFGKVNGIFINYIIGWLVWFIVVVIYSAFKNIWI